MDLTFIILKLLSIGLAGVAGIYFGWLITKAF